MIDLIKYCFEWVPTQLQRQIMGCEVITGGQGDGQSSEDDEDAHDDQSTFGDKLAMQRHSLQAWWACLYGFQLGCPYNARRW